jgi:hypothetical protein
MREAWDLSGRQTAELDHAFSYPDAAGARDGAAAATDWARDGEETIPAAGGMLEGLVDGSVAPAADSIWAHDGAEVQEEELQYVEPFEDKRESFLDGEVRAQPHSSSP